MRNWINDAEHYLYDYYQRACDILDSDVKPIPLIIVPALDEDEARCFVLGLESGVFNLSEHGYVQSSMLPSPAGKADLQKMIQLYWRRPKKKDRFLFREGVCQLATVSSLILEHGWNANHIRMEPSIAEFGDLAYGVDILIKDTENNLTICGEVKKSRAEFQKLVDGFRYCCQRGPHAKEECSFARNHSKYEFCSAIKPAYFFATAPGEKICFRLVQDGGARIVQEIQGLPHRILC